MTVTTVITAIKARPRKLAAEWVLDQSSNTFGLIETAKVTFRSIGYTVVVDLISADAKEYVLECTGMNYTTIVLDKDSELLTMLKLKFEGQTQ